MSSSLSSRAFSKEKNLIFVYANEDLSNKEEIGEQPKASERTEWKI